MHLDYLCPMLVVFDMNTSLEFYVDILGFEIHQKAGEDNDIGWVWLRHGEVNLMLNTQYELSDRPPTPDQVRNSNHGDTVLYIGCPDVDAAYKNLAALGLKLDPPQTASYGMKQLYFSDPDGYGICFQWPHTEKR